MPAKITQIRAREIAELRKEFRELRAMLDDLRARADENDRTLLVLHKLALLLAAKGGRGKSAAWRSEAETILAKLAGRGGRCVILIFGGRETPASRAAAKIPAVGVAGDPPLPDGVPPVAGMRSGCIAPLRRNRKTVGAVILSSPKAGFFPEDSSRDFLRRMADLLAAGV